ncbi:hypothetical protein SAMN04488577_2615 [Bacillus sp. cl95]|nr:hypothetical protein SAMN02799634_102495 [Bacillus sp. UNCCL13]SFQ85309.1 hypothetical protein SAMN04488577_2615 [Bacillus sp. cl95]
MKYFYLAKSILFLAKLDRILAKIQWIPAKSRKNLAKPNYPLLTVGKRRNPPSLEGS